MDYSQILVLLIAIIFIITTLGYGLAYILSLIFNFKLKTPIPVIFTTGCILAAFIIQSILLQWGLQQQTLSTIFLLITVSIFIVALLYCYLFRRL